MGGLTNMTRQGNRVYQTYMTGATSVIKDTLYEFGISLDDKLNHTLASEAYSALREVDHDADISDMVQLLLTVGSVEDEPLAKRVVNSIIGKMHKVCGDLNDKRYKQRSAWFESSYEPATDERPPKRYDEWFPPLSASSKTRKIGRSNALWHPVAVRKLVKGLSDPQKTSATLKTLRQGSVRESSNSFKPIRELQDQEGLVEQLQGIRLAPKSCSEKGNQAGIVCQHEADMTAGGADGTKSQAEASSDTVFVADLLDPHVIEMKAMPHGQVVQRVATQPITLEHLHPDGSCSPKTRRLPFIDVDAIEHDLSDEVFVSQPVLNFVVSQSNRSVPADEEQSEGHWQIDRTVQHLQISNTPSNNHRITASHSDEWAGYGAWFAGDTAWTSPESSNLDLYEQFKHAWSNEEKKQEVGENVSNVLQGVINRSYDQREDPLQTDRGTPIQRLIDKSMLPASGGVFTVSGFDSRHPLPDLLSDERVGVADRRTQVRRCDSNNAITLFSDPFSFGLSFDFDRDESNEMLLNQRSPSFDVGGVQSSVTDAEFRKASSDPLSYMGTQQPVCQLDRETDILNTDQQHKRPTPTKYLMQSLGSSEPASIGVFDGLEGAVGGDDPADLAVLANFQLLMKEVNVETYKRVESKRQANSVSSVEYISSGSNIMECSKCSVSNAELGEIESSVPCGFSPALQPDLDTVRSDMDSPVASAFSSAWQPVLMEKIIVDTNKRVESKRQANSVSSVEDISSGSNIMECPKCSVSNAVMGEIESSVACGFSSALQPDLDTERCDTDSPVTSAFQLARRPVFDRDNYVDDDQGEPFISRKLDTHSGEKRSCSFDSLTSPSKRMREEYVGNWLLQQVGLDYPKLPGISTAATELESRWFKESTNYEVQIPKLGATKPPGIQPKVCSLFLSGRCERDNCKYSHAPALITCRHWEQSKCFKGSACPFLHGYLPTGCRVSDTDKASDKSTSKDTSSEKRKRFRRRSGPSSTKSRQHN